jgi:hypothetical protein
MGAAAGVISAAGSLYNMYNSYKNAKNNKAMSYSDALAQAQNSLNSLYDKNVTNTVNSLDNAAARRGFYGQAAADQIKSNTIGDIRANQASAVANLATQLQNGSQVNAANAQNTFQNNLNGLTSNSSGLNGLWNYLQTLGQNKSGTTNDTTNYYGNAPFA